MSTDSSNKKQLSAPLPDPLWPTGALPDHLSPEVRAQKEVQDNFVGVAPWTCKKCGTHLNKSVEKPTYCATCYKLEASNSALAQKNNATWMEQSEASGLALFERQPEENDLEWLIWTRYREHYPMKLPTWAQLAKECNTSVAKVVQTSQVWSFRVRMQSWARFTDDENAETRIDAIKEMNKRQVNMAKVLQTKIAAAIDKLDPMLLRPNELVQLMKVSTELERRIVTATPERVDGTVSDTATKQKQLTKAEDLSEVVSILAKTGMLPGQGLAVEQTTTTRIVAKGEEQAVDVIYEQP